MRNEGEEVNGLSGTFQIFQNRLKMCYTLREMESQPWFLLFSLKSRKMT